MMKPAVTNPAFRKLRYAFTLASCLLTSLVFGQPTPQITGDSAVCQADEYVYSTPFTLDNIYTWSVSAGGTITQDLGNSITVIWTGAQNSTQTVMVTETEPGPGGLSGSDQLTVYIKNEALSCNNHVNASLDQNGLAIFEPDMILEGNYNTYEGYTVSFILPNGVDIGNTLSCDYIGNEVTAKVTDDCSGNSCWGAVTVEDKTPPTWTCPSDTTNIACDTDIDAYPPPPVTDNCDLNPLVAQTGLEVINTNVCDGVLIRRDFVATDEYDNESTCTQYLEIKPDDQDVIFPDDVFLLCNVYNDFPNMTDPTELTGDPNTTGAGVPVANSGPYCIYNVVAQDDTLMNCGNTFKIVRTWLVFNWCTGEVVTQDSNGDDNEQIIKIIDITDPALSVPNGISLDITESTGSVLTCTSKDLLPPPTSYSDDCGDVTIRIFTPVGEAVYVNGIDGKEGGYVPEPGLNLGNHAIRYKAIDECGNETEVVRTVNVTDSTPPTSICDEITDVNLNENGEALVYADIFDDGSHDNCCIQAFEAKRMGEPDLNFAPAIPFDCNDDEVMVVVRVIDCFGNYNECMVTALINDKMNPTCVAPQNKTISCVDLPADIDDDFIESQGQAFAYDNCDVEVEELSSQVSLDNCGEGLIIRNFQAVDSDGNVSLNNCQQFIYITPNSDWLINFPQNWTGDCGDSIAAPEIEVGNFACDLFAVSFEDQYFGLSNDSACFKIVRTWRVINWCNHDPDLDPIQIPTDEFGVLVDEDDYNNFGAYEYQQIIKIVDDTPPVLTQDFDAEFCTEDDDCATGEVDLPLIIDGECTSDFEIVHHIDLGNDGSYEINGLGFFSGTLPIGLHKILYLVTDGCGNESELEIEFEIVDCKKPTAVCSNGLIVEIMQTGMIEVCAAQLDEYSFDNCPGPFKFSFSSDVSETCRIFDCDDIGQTPIEVWVTDAAGNQDFCETFIIIQDNMNVCVGAPLIGSISTEQENGLEGVSVELNSDMGPIMATSNVDGMYEFPQVALDHDYTVTPTKNDDPLNGVTTFDIVLITKHILGTQPLETPYQMIAADANNSMSISTFDLLTLRKLVLFIDDEFPNNTSWRFVKKDYAFPNPLDPWEEIFPEVINLNNFDQAVLDADFVAVKIGDVNGTAILSGDDFGAGSVEDRNGDNLMFGVEDLWVEAGQTVPVELSAKDFNDVYGFQFTFEFDTQSLEFQSVVSTSLTDEENYGLSLLNEGAITALWYEPLMVNLTDGETVLTMEFTATASGYLSDMISISSRFTNAEAYMGETMEVMGVDLDFNEVVSSSDESLANGFELFQNVPNPFSTQTTIGFKMPSTADATISVFDGTGRTLWETTGTFFEGYNEVVLQAKDLPGSAALFYKIESQDFTAVKQMTVVK